MECFRAIKKHTVTKETINDIASTENQKFYSKLASGISEAYIESFIPETGVERYLLLLKAIQMAQQKGILI